MNHREGRGGFLEMTKPRTAALPSRKNNFAASKTPLWRAQCEDTGRSSLSINPYTRVKYDKPLNRVGACGVWVARGEKCFEVEWQGIS